MSLTGITFANQKITPSDDGRLYGAVLSDGILTGCSITFAAATLTIGGGSLLIGTRELRTSGETLSLTGATSGFARVIIDIDLTRAATKTSFEQAQFQVQYAASVDAFPALEIQPINWAGTHYQAAFCIVSLSAAGITGIVARLGQSVVPIKSGGTGSTTAEGARAALGALSSAAGAVGTDNLGSGVVTRDKLAATVPVMGALSIGSGNPFVAANNGKTVCTYTTNAIDLAITSELLASLPAGFIITLMKADNTSPYTLRWNGLSVMNMINGTWQSSATGSVSLYRFGDAVTIAKTSDTSFVIIGHSSVRNIYAGTSDPPASLGNPGDIYVKY